MQTRTPPLIRNCWQTELLPWDYTAVPDLTFSVFSGCKYPHRPTCSRLTPLLTEERVDPMLGDPDLPMLPLPNANFVTRPPYKHFGGERPLAPSAPSGAWEPAPVVPDQLPAPQPALLCATPAEKLHTYVLSLVGNAGCDARLHFLSAMPPFLT